MLDLFILNLSVVQFKINHEIKVLRALEDIKNPPLVVEPDLKINLNWAKLLTYCDDSIMLATECLRLRGFKRAGMLLRAVYTAYFAFVPMSLPPEALQIKFYVYVSDAQRQEQTLKAKKVLGIK